LINTSLFALQENKVDPKLLDELVGAYEFKIQEQPGAYIFIQEEGILKGAPAGEEPTELAPVEGEDLTFMGYSEDGAKQLFRFLRNDTGKVVRCIFSIPDMGLLVEMFKLE
jgi:hypothetical protein